jgi:deazaflavin-dependent oxidoreductase (nitroreductase family)
VARLPEAPQANSPFWWVWERFTDVHKVAYRASHGRIGGTYGKAPVALVDSVGRKTGNRRTHPLLATKDGENVVVVASKGGVDRNPAWYHNLMANPETTVNWYGEVRRMRARETEGTERERLWKQMTEVYPTYEDYQRRTKRRIPVILLEPVSGE